MYCDDRNLSETISAAPRLLLVRTHPSPAVVTLYRRVSTSRAHYTHRAQPEHCIMKALLVCSVLVAATSAQYLGYPYALGSPLTYTYTPHVVKPVIKEVEVPYDVVSYAVKETGCVNSFNLPVPCAQEGEARRKRAADEEAAAEAPAAAPVLAYAGLPYAYGGLGYPYSYGLPYAYPQVQVAEPTVTEVEVPQLKYVPVEKKIELLPACHNGLGFPVPCA